MVVAGGLTLIRHQDILNRHSEIGRLHIYRHAIFFRKVVPWCQLLCGSGKVIQCKRLHLCFCCDCIDALFVMTVTQSIPAWCYFFKRHRMSPVQVVTLYKPKPTCCFIKDGLYFGYVLSSPVSALVLQMARYRQATLVQVVAWCRHTYVVTWRH